MLLGMSLETFTVVHVIISLIAIVAGLVVAFAMLRNRLPSEWNALFLVTTVLTTATGFMFPFHGVTPAIKLGVATLPILLLAIVACYGLHLARGWRRLYAITAVLALYLNFFALVAQSFQKVPQLKALAPTQSEPPFLASQLVALVLFIVLGVLAAKRFHNPRARRATAIAGSTRAPTP